MNKKSKRQTPHEKFALMIFKNTMFLKSCRALINCRYQHIRMIV